MKRIKLILQFFEGARLAFVLAIVASLFTTILNSLTPQVFRFGIDSVIGGDERYAFLADHLWLLAGLLILIALLSGLTQFVFRYVSSKAGETFAKNMRDLLFKHIQRLPITWQNQNQTGDIIQRCTTDVETIRNFVVTQLLEVFRTVFLVAVSFGMMWSMNVKLSLLVLLFVPIIVGYSGVFYTLIESEFLKADEAEGELSTVVQENATGVRVIRAFGRERYEMDHFKEKNNNYADIWIRLGKILGVYWGFGDFFTGLQVIVVIVVGSVLAVHGQITVGEFIAFASYNTSLTWPIRGLGRILSEMSKAGVSFDRIEYIVESIEENYGDVNDHGKVYDSKDDKQKQTDAVGSATENPLKQEDGSYIVFDHVNYSYNQKHEVLHNINFKIPKGATIGILGGTGSGKSTVVQLLMRLYEVEDGAIRIDGRDVKDIPLQELRQMIGIVLQEPFLYSRTIFENIAAHNPAATLEDVRRAAKIACVDDAIMSFPDQYNTIVGERGITLSGGQRQRVAIARMLMEEAPIMIFDDSLSAVDSETDYHIRTALKEEMKDATVFLISHRITSLMSTDYILVMKDGRIAEEGSHSDLIKMNGIYHEIYDIQMNLDDRLELETETKLKDTLDWVEETEDRTSIEESTEVSVDTDNAQKQNTDGGEA